MSDQRPSSDERKYLQHVGEQYSAPIPEGRVLVHSPYNVFDFLATYAEAAYWYSLGYMVENPDGTFWSIR